MAAFDGTHFHLTAPVAASSATFAQSGLEPAGKDWPHTSGNLAYQGYTSLTQISKSNIQNLGPAWQTNLSRPF